MGFLQCYPLVLFLRADFADSISYLLCWAERDSALAAVQAVTKWTEQFQAERQVQRVYNSCKDFKAHIMPQPLQA